MGNEAQESGTARSVGIVVPATFHHDDRFDLRCGETLDGFDLVYETYGALNARRSNAVLICHALSGNHHAAGYHAETDTKPGWWDTCIGPGKAVDTNRFFVGWRSLNNLGAATAAPAPPPPIRPRASRSARTSPS